MFQQRRAFVLILLCATAASATVFDHLPSDRELIDRSDLVVVATVRRAASHVRPDNGWVVTDYEMAVEETLKGTAGGTITVSEVGGVAGGRFTVISDAATYTPGERVLVFLHRAGDGTYFTTAMSLGKFEFARNVEGESVALRDTGDFGAEPGRLEGRFKEFIRGGTAAYQTKLQPIASALKPKASGNAKNYCATASDGFNTRPIRWDRTASNPNVPPFVSNAADPGGGIAAAAAAWTNDPISFIVLSYGGTGAPPSPAFDHINGVYLNYTGSPPPGIPCADSVGCAVEQGDAPDNTWDGDTFFSITDTDLLVFPSGMGGAFNAVIIHEMGHALGFRHSNEGQPFSTQAVMNSSVNFTTLQQWDKDAVDSVYGSGPPCQPLNIDQQPNNAAIPAGGTVTLQVFVSGTNPHYQWYDGVGPDTSNPVGIDNSSFTTPPINTVKHYWVRVTNSCSSRDSNTATITPQAPPNCQPPHITQQPAGGSINTGQTFTLSMQTSGTPPLSFRWYLGLSGDISNPISGATSATFTTPPLTQTKSYWVDVANACGEDKSATATITVTPIGPCGKPTFTIQPLGFTGQSGKPAILFALAAGDGTIAYQWYQGTAPDTSIPLAGQLPSNARWVSQVYADLLGRLATAGDVATFTGLLGGGASRTSVALNVLSSTEYRTNLIGSFYASYLRRAASAGDVAFWMPAFVGGFTDEQIAAQITGSPEYFTLSGGTNVGWLNRLFNDVLGRAPSAPETTTYLGLLGGSSRTNVALSILNSTEERTRRVQGWYTQFLRRAAAGAEVSALLGANDEDAMAAILASDEYFNFPSMLITSPLTATTKFWVRASNSCGPTDSATATVTIPCPPPVIVSDPADMTLNVGESPNPAVVATGATAYQWYRGLSGDINAPIAGATGPILSNVNGFLTGITTYWVRVSNTCGSVNSRTVTITINCVPPIPRITLPPAAPSTSPVPVSWSGDPNVSKIYDLDEATAADFTAGLKTFSITDGSTSFTIPAHTAITADTRFYYRVRSRPLCGGIGNYSAAASILLTIPPAPNQPNYSFAQLPCPTSPCTITQTYHINGFNTAGKSALATDQFSVNSDKPFITVTPSSGNLPPEGADVTITINAGGLDVGSTQASLTVTRTPGAAKVGALGDPPTTTTVPINVSLVAPVTPKPKDGNAPLNTLLIPAVAHADGIGTRFVSDVRLTNTASQPITYDLTFTPSNIDGTTSGKQATITVQGGQTTALNDIVKDWYGAGAQGEGGLGTVEIRPRNYAAKDSVNIAFATVAASRTYAISSNGTFGQFIPALSLLNFIGNSSSSVISLQQVAQSPSYRTNLGLVEGLGQPANMVVKLFDDRGTLLAQRPLSLRPFEAQQTRLDSFFNGFTVSGAPLPTVADARVQVNVTSDSGRVTAYASVIDNATTDPLLVFPVDPSKIAAKRFVVPGVAEFDNGFSNFHTDMRIYNAASAPATVTLNFSGAPAQLPAVQRTLAAGEVLAVDNVLGTLWSTTGGGAVIATTTADSQLVLTARTFSRDANGGTFGQFIPGVTAADAVGVGDRALQVVQLEQSPSFRSNLGLVEVTGNPVTVEILGYTPESKIAARTEQTLSGGQFTQLGSVFTSMGFGSVYNGRISVRAIGGTGRIAAYGSVVDARTADPTYVPAQ